MDKFNRPLTSRNNHKVSSKTIDPRRVHWPPKSPVVPLQERFEEDLAENEPVFQASFRKQLNRYEYFYGPFAYYRITDKRRNSHYKLDEESETAPHHRHGPSFDQMIREKIDAHTLQGYFRDNVILNEEPSKSMLKRSKKRAGYKLNT